MDVKGHKQCKLLVSVCSLTQGAVTNDAFYTENCKHENVFFTSLMLL